MGLDFNTVRWKQRHFACYQETVKKEVRFDHRLTAWIEHYGRQVAHSIFVMTNREVSLLRANYPKAESVAGHSTRAMVDEAASFRNDGERHDRLFKVTDHFREHMENDVLPSGISLDGEPDIYQNVPHWHPQLANASQTNKK
ncbi:hypothetical protein LTR17_022819 [Elasticomyces elasticus]|nr:hypothetical protein LTR17_022819 [Elasticomyces elasticus]